MTKISYVGSRFPPAIIQQASSRSALEVDVLGASRHCIPQRGALHCVVVVLDKSKVTDGNAALFGEREDFLHVGRIHPGGEE